MLSSIFKKYKSKSFTLTETIVMISIILILTGIIIVATKDSRALARDRKRIAHFAAYQQALARYYSQHKEFPNPKPEGGQGEQEACENAGCIYNSEHEICTCKAEIYLKMLKDEGFIDVMMADPLNDEEHWYSYNVDDSGQNYKLAVLLEKDQAAMKNDGGSCPLGEDTSKCPDDYQALYEVYSTLGAQLAFGYWGISGRGNLACGVVPGTSCTSEKPLAVLRLSNQTNAHAALVSSGSYNYTVCCSGPADLSVAESNCSGVCSRILTLSSQTNAHVGTAYSNALYFKRSGGNLDCAIRDNNCASGETCVVSISNTTNAHIGNCDNYTKKVCCKAPSNF